MKLTQYQLPTKKHWRSGFTLVEMLVSIALFAVAVTISMGSLLTLVDANARAQAVQVGVNNLSFALDAMTRQIRTGTDYYCHESIADITSGSAPGTINSGVRACDAATAGKAFAFTDSRTGARIAYTISGTTIQRKIDPSFGAPGEWQDLTGSNIEISELEFTLRGTGGGANQPAVSIFIEATVGDVEELGATTTIQTTVTQRQLKLI